MNSVFAGNNTVQYPFQTSNFSWAKVPNIMQMSNWNPLYELKKIKKIDVWIRLLKKYLPNIKYKSTKKVQIFIKNIFLTVAKHEIHQLQQYFHQKDQDTEEIPAFHQLLMLPQLIGARTKMKGLKRSSKGLWKVLKTFPRPFLDNNAISIVFQKSCKIFMS